MFDGVSPLIKDNAAGQRSRTNRQDNQDISVQSGEVFVTGQVSDLNPTDQTEGEKDRNTQEVTSAAVQARQTTNKEDSLCVC